VEEQLLVILDKGTESGAVDQKEIELIESVFDFDDINVARIMTPRPDIYSLELSTPWRQVLLACQHSEWSRIPIFDGRSDNIVGVFLVKDLLKAEKESKGDKQSLLNLMLQPAFVPGSKTAEDMLNEFIERNNHMAFVVDEHGTLTGLVTMDDLLEQLVGDFDVHAQASEILKIRTNTFRVKASTDLDDFANEIGVNPTNSEHHSVGALVFHILGQMPTIGDSIEWQNYRFTVSTMDGRRIDEILVEQILSNKAAI
jgi:CBS domain containing-hemolysin-like protein